MIGWVLKGQEIAIYSEFQRFDPFGHIVSQDYEPSRREIISPAVARNGHVSVQVVVTAPAGTNYFLYAASNPPDIVQIKIYREHFISCGAEYCPDWLTEQRSPSFGAMPESTRSLPNQTTRCYLFDIFVPGDLAPGRVRVEALIKTAFWSVAPMELRVIDARVPEISRAEVREDIAGVSEPSGETARRQLLRFASALKPEMPQGIMRLRDVIQRNAAEDMLLASSPDPALALAAWPGFGFLQPGAEWYLAVRDLIYRKSERAHVTR